MSAQTRATVAEGVGVIGSERVLPASVTRPGPDIDNALPGISKCRAGRFLVKPLCSTGRWAKQR
jgi:hypothetical protein